MLFEENFDAQADWEPNDEFSTCAPVCSEGAPPTNWNYYFVSEQWVGGGFKPSVAINNEQPRGGAGKSMIFYQENRAISGWVSDGDMVKRLDQEYPELYVRFWLKFQPGFAWAPISAPIFKLFRIYRYADEGSPFQFFRNEVTPLFVSNIGNNAFGNRQVFALRCRGAADDSDYFCPNYPNSNGGSIETNYVPVENETGVPFTDFYSSIGDGDWHKFEFVIKINSAPGVNDGVFRRWIDGHLTYERTDIDFVRATDTTGEVTGFNMVGFGGNDFNRFDDLNQTEQYYAIDDIIIISPPPPSAPVNPAIN